MQQAEGILKIIFHLQPEGRLHLAQASKTSLN